MIEVKNLTKQYGEKLALDGVSFSIDKGEVVGLLGLNGAGKSTTMNILTGYLSPTDGTAMIDGYDIVQKPRQAKSRIGYLPEQLAFYGDMRVDEYLAFVCELKGVKANAKEHIAAICERVGIAHVSRRMVRNLSKGYRQRVGFAQALVGKPKVLILDEPTVGLDPSQIKEVRALIKSLAEESTVIISSHILSEIQAICTRVIMLYNGKIVADGAPDNLGQSDASRAKLTVRVRGDAADIKRVLATLDGVRCRQLQQAEPGSWDFELVAPKGGDIRADVFRALARADLPLLQSFGAQNTLEDIFLGLVRRQGGEGKDDTLKMTRAGKARGGQSAVASSGKDGAKGGKKK